MDRSPQTSPGHERPQQPKPVFVRPPYLDEDPWSSSSPPKDPSHWTRVRQLLNKCDGDAIGSWQEEINTQLIVSSLLSALTGTFVIETQKSLSEDPIITATVLLSRIAMQLNATSAFPPSPLRPSTDPSPNARAVNSLLYVSLGLSLSNVTLGLLCLQWLRELRADTPGIPDKYYTHLHWARHTGFQRWGAKGLVSALPLLLLTSLTCFFAGLLFHVSTTDWVVSVPVGVILGVTFAVLVLTTLLPAVVIAGCAAFRQGTFVQSGGYPPIPPFHSLQSWISLQFTITILRSPLFQKLIKLSQSLRDLKHCPDWARVCFHWQYRAASTDPIFLPLIHSSSDLSRLDDVTLCLFDTQALKRVSDDNPVQMRIRSLRYYIEQYSKELPSATLEDLENKIAIQLVYYLNDGGDIADLGNSAFELTMDIKNLSTVTRTQLLHAVVHSYERQLQETDSFWDFLWLAIRMHIYPSRHAFASPTLIIRALNVVGDYWRRHSNVKLDQYLLFVGAFSRLIASYRPYTTTDHGRRVVASVLFHPAWDDLASAGRANPPTPTFDQLRERLDILEDLKYRHAFRNYVPLSFDWTAQLYPDCEPSQPYISVEMDLEARDEEFPPSPIHIHFGDHGAGHSPTSMPALMHMDVVERDGEEAVEGWVGDAVDGAVLNVGTASRTISSSDPPGPTVHMEMEDARCGLQEEEEEDASSARKRVVDGD